MKFFKSKIISLIVLTAMLLSMVPTIGLAAEDPIGATADELARVYGYLEASDKDAIDAARANLQTLAATPDDTKWDAIIDPLMTDQVIAKYSNEASARTAAIDFAAGIGDIYYSTDKTALETTLTDFKSEFAGDFTTLFGTDITMSDLYDFLIATKDEMSNAILATEVNTLAFGSNAQLVDAIPAITERAIQAVLDKTEFSTFNGKLSEIGWTAHSLIAQRTALESAIDTVDKAAGLALAKAAVRSETTLASGDTVLQVPNTTVYELQVLGKLASGLVDWVSSDTNVATIDNNENVVLTAVGVGTTTITAYRAYTGSTPENDWLYKFDVTVTAEAPSVTITAPLTTDEIKQGGIVNITGTAQNLDVVTITVRNSSDGLVGTAQLPVTVTDDQFSTSFTLNSDAILGTYTIKVGGAGLTELYESTFTVVAGDVNVSVGTFTGEAGTTVDVPIVISNLSNGLSSIQMTLNYDKDLVSVSQVVKGDLLNSTGTDTINIDDVNGTVDIGVMGTGNIAQAATGEAFIVTFSLDNAGTSNLSLTDVELSDQETTPVVYTTTVNDGSIDVTGTAVLYGDVNNDTIIDVNDVVLIMKSIVGTHTFDSMQEIAANVSGDVDGEGNPVVDVNDVVLVMKHIVGTQPTFPVEN